MAYKAKKEKPICPIRMGFPLLIRFVLMHRCCGRNAANGTSATCFS